YPEPSFPVRGSARRHEREGSGGGVRGIALVRTGNRRNLQRADGALAHVDGECDGHDRPARLLRHGGQRSVSFDRGQGASAVSYSGCGYRGAGRLHHADDRDAVSGSGGLHRDDAESVHRDERDLDVPVPPPAWMAEAARGERRVSAVSCVVHPGRSMDDISGDRAEAVHRAGDGSDARNGSAGVSPAAALADEGDARPPEGGDVLKLATARTSYTKGTALSSNG